MFRRVSSTPACVVVLSISRGHRYPYAYRDSETLRPQTDTVIRVGCRAAPPRRRACRDSRRQGSESVWRHTAASCCVLAGGGAELQRPGLLVISL